MSEPEERLYIAVIYQAAADAMGYFVDSSKLERDFLRQKFRIENPPKRKKPPKVPTPTFQQRIERNNHLHNARHWFKTAGPDFVTVCDNAGFYWKEVQERFLPTIAAIEAYEKKLFAIERPLLRRRETRRLRIEREKRRAHRVGTDVTT